MIGQALLTRIGLLMGALSAFLPIMKGADVFFGVPVSEEFMRGRHGRRYLHIYWALLAVFMISSIASVWMLATVPAAIVIWEAWLLLVILVLPAFLIPWLTSR